MRFAPHTALPRVKGMHQPRDSAVLFSTTATGLHRDTGGEGQQMGAARVGSKAARSYHRPRRCLTQHHSQKTRTSNDTKETPRVAPLMTTVTQDNDAHDNSENGGVEYNTCV